MQTPFVDGSAAPDGRRSWPLTVRRVEGGVWIGFVSPQGEQAIAGVHGSLRALLERLPPEIELPFLCRVHDGRVHDVRELIALQLDYDNPLVANAVRFIDDPVVEGRPELLAARFRDCIARGESEGAVKDFRHLCASRIPTLDCLFFELNAVAQEEVAPQFRAWVARAELPESRLRRIPLELRSASILVAPTEATAVAADEEPPAERLLPALLASTLRTRDRDAISVYADALMEQGHVYGTFLALHLQGTISALREARDLAEANEHVWLGALARVLDRVTYENGLPIAARFRGAAGSGLGLALRHPLAPAFRKVLRKRSKVSRRAVDDPAEYVQLARTLLPHALVELDCADDALVALSGSDLQRVTHLHDLDLHAKQLLDARSLPAVDWVELRVTKGRDGTDAVLQALTRSHRAFFEARRPHVELAYSGMPSASDVARVRALVGSLPARSISVGGEHLGN
jgi:hypothetical protein